ncbi:putative cytochrome P450 monooxygenase (lovA) [Fusarium austroafricanum]|uniref:Putative cytochrome P450 monooxygenase (LovA) n=1 Tax=Fusarium austroafricanum TaxID=2364996 RepID=A0A8H4K6D1_9HYPO|nr:putative cytochrome P450 monooxygenase (lovA) [Fusarium austroafricanum]
MNSKHLLAKGRFLYNDKPYKAYTDWGEVLIIPPQFAESLKNNRQLEFMETAKDDIHGYLPGFEPGAPPIDITPVVNKYLTRALAKLTTPLSEEASLVVHHVLGDSTEWHEMQPQHEIIRIVSRMSSRVFMGKELCRDEGWLKASSDYTIQWFIAGEGLRYYPRWMRPYIHWFLPSCQAVRKKLDEARKFLQPHIDRRNATKQEAIAKGRPSPFDDSIIWFEKEYPGQADPARDQIGLSLVAIHTTTDLLTETLFNIALHPELLKPLREEIVSVLSTDGMKKTSLYNMKLLDSVIKESQRLRPVLLGVFRRTALSDITLPNGDVIKKGTKIVCDTTHQWNPEYYKDALKFDAYRFVRMRETSGQDKQAHLVSTSHNMLGFGHGVHSCPGRFFAANEIKIALCHMLLKYDWKIPDGVVPESSWFGMALLGDQKAKLLVRRRKEELDINAIEKE